MHKSWSIWFGLVWIIAPLSTVKGRYWMIATEWFGGLVKWWEMGRKMEGKRIVSSKKMKFNLQNQMISHFEYTLWWVDDRKHVWNQRMDVNWWRSVQRVIQGLPGRFLGAHSEQSVLAFHSIDIVFFCLSANINCISIS